MKALPIIIDCDPGHDDAIALIMALSNPKLNVIGITTTAGNQTIEKTTKNACKIVSFLNKSTKIAMGAKAPLCRELEIAPSVHGDSGLDGPVFPEVKVFPEEIHALEFTRKLLLEAEEKVTLVSTGPLTNTGILLAGYPELKEKIKEIVIMGGGIDHGNWTTAAEFNILVDPEAAAIVFKSGIPLVMCGLDVTEKALVLPEEFEEFRSLGTPVAVLVAELLDFFWKFHKELGFEGAPLHDPCTIAYLLKPELFETEELYVQVETRGELTTGQTFADKRINPGKAKPNTKVCMGVKRRELVELLKACVEAY